MGRLSSGHIKYVGNLGIFYIFVIFFLENISCIMSQIRYMIRESPLTPRIRLEAPVDLCQQSDHDLMVLGQENVSLLAKSFEYCNLSHVL